MTVGEAAGSPMSRRRLLTHDRSERGQRGDVPGDAQSGLCGGVRVSGTDRLERRAEGRLGAGARRRHRRHGRRIRTAQCRLPRAGARIQRPRRRAQLDAARRRSLHRTGRRQPRSAASIPACTSIPARGACRITIAACCSYCKRLGVALEPFVQVNYNAYLHSQQGVRRQAAALARRQGRLPGSRRGAAGEGHAESRAR